MTRRARTGRWLAFGASAFAALGEGAAATGGTAAADGVLALNTVGCNATSLAQFPDRADLFMGRQLLTAGGQIAGITGPNDCSGADANRWALTLVNLDWKTHRFSLGKVLLDTSIDAATGRSRAVLTGGPMRGAVVRSAYDADVVRFAGEYWVAFECVFDNGETGGKPPGKPPGPEGTSSCLGVYDPVLQTVDLSRTEAIIAGARSSAGLFTAAAVPQLLVYRNRLFIYWSALSVDEGRFAGITIRGAELSVSAGKAAVKGADGRLVHSTDVPATTQVWAVDPADALSDTTADLRALWVTRDGVVGAAGLGGRGCTSPSGVVKGCFRLAMAEASDPLAENAFNRGRRIDAGTLPSNPQEYTRPVLDPAGTYWLMGHFMRPRAGGYSEARPMPSADFWNRGGDASAFVMFPFVNRALWPVN
jgi:hypothetical protein